MSQRSHVSCPNTRTLNELARLLQEEIPLVISAQRRQYRLAEFCVASRGQIVDGTAAADEEPLLDERDRIAHGAFVLLVFDRQIPSPDDCGVPGTEIKSAWERVSAYSE